MNMKHGDVAIETLRRTLEEHMGLSPYEMDVYLALVRGGKQSMKKIADESGMPKQRVYDIVQELQSERLIEVVDEHPTQAYAIDPTEALDPLEERLTTAQRQLERLHETVDEVDGGVEQPCDEETSRYANACSEALPETLDPQRVVFGFDGFVDRVREAVESRSGSTSYEPMSQLGSFGERITSSTAGGSSCTVEWVGHETRAGGHTAHLGRAFSALGSDPTLIGTFDHPVQPPFETALGEHTLISIGTPTYTDAVEFDDGKLLLTDTGRQATLDWSALCEEIGLTTLAEHIDGAELLGIGYWGMIPSMPTIWDGVRSDLWPLLDSPPENLLVDTADVRQLTTERLETGLEALGRLDDTVPVVLSANRAELMTLARSFDDEPGVRSLDSAARLVRDEIGVTRIVGHSPKQATLATVAGTSSVQVPYTNTPELTTSAGDHFNTGVALGLLLGLSDGATLVVANAVAGYFVRNGCPPTYPELRAFVSNYEQRFTNGSNTGHRTNQYTNTRNTKD